MVSNEEIKLRLKAKRYGLDPDQLVSEGLDLEEELNKLQIPSWVGDVCVFDFGSVPVNVLSIIIGNLFKSWYYHLEEGTCLNGVYKRVYAPYGGNVFIMPRIYQFKVEIDSNGGKTYLKISEAANGMIMTIDKIIYGKNYLKLELNHIVDEIKYLKPLSDGYLVCDKCNEYYKLQPGESPYDFTNKCECGGNLKYYKNID